MAQPIAFDTHAYVKKLKAVGFSEEQAEVQAETLAEFIDERLATKHNLKELEVVLKRDIAEIKRDMKEMETTLQHDMKEMETTLQHDMKEMETTLQNDMKELKRDMKEMEMRLTIKLGALTTTGIVIVAALVKLL